ncbi:uncharacterized protein PV07_12736 [Cladophialophora immunda]|uniref:Uncharacterized protein n=1 Tax=Cladophialophora immunda TaxID=569365 RepID=A0A0D1Z2E8_9EURO|nr:uncharacterized protein PV07_12736 [Cladophialophora immunda]KIW21841.1 hypothetical protein PV07_12736 [Cladophialophora immunda]
MQVFTCLKRLKGSMEIDPTFEIPLLEEDPPCNNLPRSMLQNTGKPNGRKRAQTTGLSLPKYTAVMQRPLLIAKLAAIVNLEGSLSRKLIVWDNALKIEKDQISFVHLLSGDHLQQKRPEDRLNQFHLEAAETCLKYLTGARKAHAPFNATTKSGCAAEYKGLVGAQPFIEYAATFWPVHVRHAGPRSLPKLWPHIVQTLNDASCRELSFQVYQFCNHEEYIPEQSFLHILANYGLTAATEKALSLDTQATIQLDLNARDSKSRTPLWWAVKNQRVEMVKLLLAAQNVDFNAQDDEGMSPVMVAVAKGFTDVTKLFLEPEFSSRVSWALRDHQEFTCLYWAATSGFDDLVSLLLTQNEVVQTINGSGHSPLVTAARKGHAQIVKDLLFHGASPNATDTCDGRAALSWAAGNGHEDVVDNLLYGEEVDLAHADRKLKWTAFQWAAERENGAIARKILGVTSEKAGSGGCDPISALFLEVAKRGQGQALEILLEQFNSKADCRDGDTSGRTALSYAAERGHVNVVEKLLCSHSVGVNSGDVKGKTALMWAADQGRSGVVEVLLAWKELDVRAVDSDGRCAHDWASASNHVGIRRLIERLDQECSGI